MSQECGQQDDSLRVAMPNNRINLKEDDLIWSVVKDGC